MGCVQTKLDWDSDVGTNFFCSHDNGIQRFQKCAGVLRGYTHLRAFIAGEYRMRPLRDGLLPKPITYLTKYRNQKAIFSIKQSDFQCCTYLRVSGSQETQAFKLYVYKGSIQQVQPAYTTIFTVLGLHLEKCETRYHDPVQRHHIRGLVSRSAH